MSALYKSRYFGSATMEKVALHAEKQEDDDYLVQFEWTCSERKLIDVWLSDSGAARSGASYVSMIAD